MILGIPQRKFENPVHRHQTPSYPVNTITMTNSPSPYVLALHGFTGCGADFDGLSFGSNAQWLCPDLPGHGTFSQARRTDFALKRWSLQLIKSLRNKPIVGVGYSMGGRLLLHLACRFPHRFQSLILIGASPGIHDSDERKQRRENDKKLAKRIFDLGTEKFLEEWSSLSLIKTQSERIPALQYQVMQENRLRQCPQGLALSLLCHGTGTLPSLWDKLSTLTMPISLWVGREDEKFLSIAETMLQYLPNAHLKIIENAGHAAHLENQEAAKQILSELLYVSSPA